MLNFRKIGLPAICFCLLYWGITAFSGHLEEHRELTAEIALLVAVGLLVLRLACGKAIGPFTTKTVFFWVTFFLLGWASAQWGEADGVNHQLKLYFAVVMLGFAFFSWMESPSNALVAGVFLAVCFAHVLVLNIVVGTASGLLPSIVSPGSPVPYHSNIRHVAYHGMIAACAGLSLGFMGGRLRLAGCFLGAAAVFGLVFLGQRGGLLGFLVFIVAAVFLLPDMRRKIAAAGALMLLLAFVLVFVLDRQGIGNRYSGSMIERIDTRGAEVVTSSSSRVDIWKESIRLGVKKPLLGYGPDGYRHSGIAPPYNHFVQPHNAVIQLFLELGAVGLALFVWYLYPVVRQSVGTVMQARANRQLDPGLAFLGALLLGVLAFAMVDGLFYHPVPLLAIAVLVPLFFALQQQQARNASPLPASGYC